MCEASSFQLEDAVEFAPEGAVLLNVQPDHLDRHGTFEDYLGAKLRVFARQGNDDVAVAPAGLDVGDLGGCARRVPFGPGGELDDRAGWLWWDEQPLVAHEEIRLRGAHNRDNAAAAAAIALARGISLDAVRAGLRSFAGVEHRLEDVATVGGVLYVNDSKATNVASTLVALASFRAQVHLILGGLGKGQDFSPLRGRAHRVYLIGSAAAQLEREVGGGALSGRSIPRSGERAPRRCPATSSCCRPPARASTSSPTTSSAGWRSRRSSRRRAPAAGGRSRLSSSPARSR